MRALRKRSATPTGRARCRSHVFDVPLKTNVAVAGVARPGDADSLHVRLRNLPRRERAAVQVDVPARLRQSPERGERCDLQVSSPLPTSAASHPGGPPSLVVVTKEAAGEEAGKGSRSGPPGKGVVPAGGWFRPKARENPWLNCKKNRRDRGFRSLSCPTSRPPTSTCLRFKPVSGRVDQAAGLVWRYQNEDNYYIVRANALENNVVLYKVENGKRTDLPVKGEGRT